MTCRTWWIIASIVFLVGMIMSGCSYIFTAASLWFVLLSCGLNVAGWVLWAIGLISYLRWR